MNPAYEDLPLAAIDTLSYSTFIADGVSPDLVPAFRLPVLYTSGTAFTTLVFEPSQSEDLPDVEPGTWQSWDLLSAEARWRSSRDIPDSNPTIFEDTSFVSWDAILAAIPDAVILGGLHLDVGGGVVGAGHVDRLELNGAIYDFEPDR
jgi:hypothetical protein